MPNQSLYALISMIKRGLFFFVGKPGASANYIHVNNVVDALVLCGSLPQASGQTYNLSDYCTLENFVASIAEALHCSVPHARFSEPFVRMLAKILGWIPRVPLTKSRIDALTTRVQFSINKIESDLGYKHSLTMREGLKDLVADWCSRNQSQSW
jgi:nucleoside-diphosphate-sugar epimerase